MSITGATEEGLALDPALRLPYEGRQTTVEEVAQRILEADESDDDLAFEGEAEPRGDSSADDESQVEGDDDDDGETEDSDEPTETLHRVKVAGEEVEVPYSELIRGYQRNGDYLRKTTEIAAERRQVQELADATAKVSEAYAQNLEALLMSYQEKMAPEERARIEREYVSVREAQAADQEAQLSRTLESEAQRLLEAIPEWKDPKVASADKKALREYAEGYGYTADDLASITDHRLMVIVRKAQQFDRMMGKAAKDLPAKIKAAPRVLQPGTRDVHTPSPAGARRKAFAEASAQSARTGRVTDAARAIEHLLDD